MSEKKEGSLYYVIPGPVMHDPDLNIYEKFLYSLITGLSNRNGYCFSGNEWFAENLGIQVRYVQNHLKSLEKKGYITRKMYSDPKNPFKKERRIFVNTDFKKSVPNAPQCTLGDAPQCTPDMQPSARIISEENPLISEEEPPTPSPVSPQPEAADVLLLLIEAIRKTKPDLKEPNWKKWLSTIDRMLRIDKRSVEDIRKVLDWLPTHEFWSLNILSAESFRAQFDKLQLQCAKGNAPNSRSNGPNFVQRALKSICDLGGFDVEENGGYFCFKRYSSKVWEKFKVSDHDFEKQILHILRKLNAPDHVIAEVMGNRETQSNDLRLFL